MNSTSKNIPQKRYTTNAENFDLSALIELLPGYTISNTEILYHGSTVAQIFEQDNFYNIFLEELGIHWNEVLSTKPAPDHSIFVVSKRTVFIIEYLVNHLASSVDVCLQEAGFKKKQYQKLMFRANIEVEYIYLLGDWFKQPRYRDVLNYIIDVGCHSYFEYLPLSRLGLPVPPTE